MALAGADHITISPPLLRELASTPVELDQTGQPAGFKSIFDEPYSEVGVQEAKGPDLARFEIGDSWQMRFTRSGDGKPAKKLIDAINIFCDMQLKIEALMKKYLDPDLEMLDPKKERSSSVRKHPKQNIPDSERKTPKQKRKKPTSAVSTKSPSSSEQSSVETPAKIRWTGLREKSEEPMPDQAIEELVWKQHNDMKTLTKAGRAEIKLENDP